MNRFRFRFWNAITASYDSAHWLDANSGEVVAIKDNNDAPHVVAEQCTGLKDKNGKLIYEGDYIKTQDGEVNKIYWNELCLGWHWETRDGIGRSINGLDGDEIEIIGNVHEKGVSK